MENELQSFNALKKLTSTVHIAMGRPPARKKKQGGSGGRHAPPVQKHTTNRATIKKSGGWLAGWLVGWLAGWLAGWCLR